MTATTQAREHLVPPLSSWDQSSCFFFSLCFSFVAGFAVVVVVGTDLVLVVGFRVVLLVVVVVVVVVEVVDVVGADLIFTGSASMETRAM